MQRRSAIRGCLGVLAAALGGCVGQLPQATGPRNPPDAPAGHPRETPDRPDLTVATFDFEADSDGALRVFGTLKNNGDVRRTGTVAVTVKIDGNESIQNTTVTVDPRAIAEWAVGFDIAHDQFAAGGNISVTVA